MKQNISLGMNRQPIHKDWKIPRYSDKFKDVLERAEKRQKMKQQIVKSTKPLFFYRVRSIGVGAFSFVYLVIEENSGAIFAQKSIHKKKITEDLFTEIKLHFYLRHENIITLHHIFNDEDYMHLVTDYAGESLFHLRMNHKLSGKLGLKQIQHIIYQLAKAIKYLHQQNIVHGDIKLENILYLEGVIKLCDFGFSQRIKNNYQQQLQYSRYQPYSQNYIQNTVKRDVVGTLQYLAPEYIQGKSAGYQRDIWALGIVCYELAIGKNPLEGLQENQKWSKMLSISSLVAPQEEFLPAQITQFINRTLSPIQLRVDGPDLFNLRLLKNYEQTYRSHQISQLSL